MHKLHELGGQETVGASLASEGRAFTSLTPVAEAVRTESAQSLEFGRGFLFNSSNNRYSLIGCCLAGLFCFHGTQYALFVIKTLFSVN